MTAIEFPWSSLKRPIRQQGFLSHSLFAHLIPDEKGTEDTDWQYTAFCV